MPSRTQNFGIPLPPLDSPGDPVIVAALEKIDELLHGGGALFHE